jgi:hypothetical protein
MNRFTRVNIGGLRIDKGLRNDQHGVNKSARRFLTALERVALKASFTALN